MSLSNARTDEDLIPILMAASPEDLGVLSDYITDSGNGRISLDNAIMSKLVAANARRQYAEEDRLLVAHEIQLFGGNTISNLARGGRGVIFREIIEDVASRLRVTFAAGDPVSVNKLPRPKGRGIRRFASQLPEVAKPQERRKRRGIYPQ